MNFFFFKNIFTDREEVYGIWQENNELLYNLVMAQIFHIGWPTLLFYTVCIQQIIQIHGLNTTKATTKTDHLDADDALKPVVVTFTSEQIAIIIGVVSGIYLIGYLLILYSASGFDIVDKTQVVFKVTKQTRKQRKLLLTDRRKKIE